MHTHTGTMWNNRCFFDWKPQITPQAYLRTDYYLIHLAEVSDRPSFPLHPLPSKLNPGHCLDITLLGWSFCALCKGCYLYYSRTDFCTEESEVTGLIKSWTAYSKAGEDRRDFQAEIRMLGKNGGWGMEWRLARQGNKQGPGLRRCQAMWQNRLVNRLI